jgi:hypothetical protein
VNQDILNLYKKAHNGGLNAQEVFWLEGQAASHPCFGMAYMILARHHYRNQSTIKNRALLKAAAYANNRQLLRNYLEDTLTPPKQKPVPVSEMRPLLDQKDAAQANPAIDLHKKDVVEAVPVVDAIAAETPIIEVNAAPVVESPVAEVLGNEVAAIQENAVVEGPVAEVLGNEVAAIQENAVVESPVAEVLVDEVAAIQENAVVEAPVAEVLVDEVAKIQENAVVELPVAEVLVEEVAAIQENAVVESPVAEVLVDEVAAIQENAVVEAPVAEVLVDEVAIIQENAVVESPVAVEYVGKPGDINWFLNMRINLRANKHHGTPERIRTEIARFAAAYSMSQTQAADLVVVEAAAPLVTESLPEVPVALEIPVIENPVVAEIAPKMEQNPSAEAPVVAEMTQVYAPSPVVEAPAASIEPAAPSVTSQEAASQAPEKQYEIGSFSSFTFLSEGGNEESEDEIDTNITMLESVEFRVADGGNSAGEIVFEENDRIIEITVSPEALQKYFKGRLPSEPLPAFGEFKIELDELEYKAAELAHNNPPAESPVDASVVVATESPEPPREMMSFELLDRPEDTPAPLQKQNIDAIIDRFIENEPGITRAKVTGIPTGDLSKGSNHVQDDDWVTETLAKIYEKQGNKPKAIKIYERLRLRFPEKNDYFAILIQKLKH